MKIVTSKNTSFNQKSRLIFGNHRGNRRIKLNQQKYPEAQAALEAALKLNAFQEHHSQYYPVTNYFKDKGEAFMSEKVESFRRWPEFCVE